MKEHNEKLTLQMTIDAIYVFSNEEIDKREADLEIAEQLEIDAIYNGSAQEAAQHYGYKFGLIFEKVEQVEK